MRLFIGILIILHGLIHLLYFGQSMRFFELQPKMVWPDDSWLFSKLLNVKTLRMVTGILCIMAAIGFVISGAGVIFSPKWCLLLTTGVVVFSDLIFILFWDGRWHNLANQGGYSFLINAVILIALFILK